MCRGEQSVRGMGFRTVIKTQACGDSTLRKACISCPGICFRDDCDGIIVWQRTRKHEPGDASPDDANIEQTLHLLYKCLDTINDIKIQ